MIEQNQQILLLYKTGKYSQTQLANMFGKSHQRVSVLLHNNLTNNQIKKLEQSWRKRLAIAKIEKYYEKK